MRREDDGALLAELADELARLPYLVGVEPDRRLVEDEDGRVVDEGLGQPDALAVALGELPYQPPLDVVDPALLHDLPDPR